MMGEKQPMHDNGGLWVKKHNSKLDAETSWRLMASIPLDAAQYKYGQKFSEYGESWKDMEHEELLGLLYDELEELQGADTDREAFFEAVDCVNIALMIAAKLKHSYLKEEREE